MRTNFYYPESPYGRTYADVITKISWMDSLPNYLSYGAPLERASRTQGAPLKIRIVQKAMLSLHNCVHIYIHNRHDRSFQELLSVYRQMSCKHLY